MGKKGPHFQRHVFHLGRLAKKYFLTSKGWGGGSTSVDKQKKSSFPKWGCHVLPLKIKQFVQIYQSQPGLTDLLSLPVVKEDQEIINELPLLIQSLQLASGQQQNKWEAICLTPRLGKTNNWWPQSRIAMATGRRSFTANVLGIREHKMTSNPFINLAKLNPFMKKEESINFAHYNF